MKWLKEITVMIKTRKQNDVSWVTLVCMLVNLNGSGKLITPKHYLYERGKSLH